VPNVLPKDSARHQRPTCRASNFKAAYNKEKGFLMATVLCVDDDLETLLECEECIESLGYNCICSPNGADALAILVANNNIDIVLSDINMPGLDGLTLLKEISSRFMHGNGLVCIMMTGDNNVTNVVESFRNDAVDFLTKPLSTHDIGAALRRASGKLTTLRESTARPEGENNLASKNISDEMQLELVADLMRVDADPNNQILSDLIAKKWLSN
jgi:DNA-binding NtrC family response regulator